MNFSTVLEQSRDRKKFCFILDNCVRPSCDNAEDAIKEIKNMGVDFSFIYYPGNTNEARYPEYESILDVVPLPLHYDGIESIIWL